MNIPRSKHLAPEIPRSLREDVEEMEEKWGDFCPSLSQASQCLEGLADLASRSVRHVRYICLHFNQ